MGIQIQFYIMPDELSGIAKYINSECNAIILEDRSSSNKPKIFEMGFESRSVFLPHCMFLTRQEYLPLIQLYHLENLNEWALDTTFNPVIQFNSSYMNKKRIRDGRLFYEKKYYNDNGVLTEKPKDFVEWAEKVFRLMKKYLVKYDDDGYNRYIGTQTFDWLKKNKKSFKFSDGLEYK